MKKGTKRSDNRQRKANADTKSDADAYMFGQTQHGLPFTLTIYCMQCTNNNQSINLKYPVHFKSATGHLFLRKFS